MRKRTLGSPHYLSNLHVIRIMLNYYTATLLRAHAKTMHRITKLSKLETETVVNLAENIRLCFPRVVSCE